MGSFYNLNIRTHIWNESSRRRVTGAQFGIGLYSSIIIAGCSFNISRCCNDRRWRWATATHRLLQPRYHSLLLIFSDSITVRAPILVIDDKNNVPVYLLLFVHLLAPSLLLITCVHDKLLDFSLNITAVTSFDECCCYILWICDNSVILSHSDQCTFDVS